MNKPSHNADLIQQIHAAALNPHLVPEMMTSLADKVEADGTQALIYSNDGGAVRSCVSGRVDSAVDDDYINHCHAGDFRIRRALAAQPWIVRDDRDFTSDSQRRQSPFHNEFLKRYDSD